jgi:hypothetical protein
MANVVYANKVIEAKAKDLLTTAVNARSMMTVDTSLTQSAGMTKTINTYTYTGAAEVVAEGEANTTRGAISHVSNDYTVLCVQQTFDYTDEDFMKDPSIVDNMLKGATQLMANKMTADLNTECAKATVTSPLSGAISYDGIVDGISELNLEDESKCFIRLPNAWKKDIRKDADYKAARMGEVVYSGQMGTVSGLPVVPTKALSAEAYVMTNEAVTLFLKKDVEVEQERDAEHRINTVILRAFYICALTDATKICKLSKA